MQRFQVGDRFLDFGWEMLVGRLHVGKERLASGRRDLNSKEVRVSQWFRGPTDKPVSQSYHSFRGHQLRGRSARLLLLGTPVFRRGYWDRDFRTAPSFLPMITSKAELAQNAIAVLRARSVRRLDIYLRLEERFTEILCGLHVAMPISRLLLVETV
jgi:hypothetical protein